MLEIGRTDFSPSALLGAPQPGTSNLVAVGLDQMAGDRWCRDQFWSGLGLVGMPAAASLAVLRERVLRERVGMETGSSVSKRKLLFLN